MKLKLIYESILQENTFYHGSPYDFNQFDITKIGTGDENQKYGYGLYFTDSFKTAAQYANDLTLSNNIDGFNVYEVKLLEQANFVDWDEPAYGIFDCVCNMLYKMGKGDVADEYREDTSEENGYDMWTFETLYEMLSYALGMPENASNALNKHCGVSGVIARNAWLDGNIYVAFSDDIIKILDKKKINT